MTSPTFPQVPLGHVVIGIEHGAVYAYYGTDPMRDTRVDFPYDPTTGHVLDLCEQVADAAQAAGAWQVSYSSTVDFWEEAIA